MRFQRQSNKSIITLGNRIGGGGEGAVYTLSDDANSVAKVYHEPTEQHGRKLAVMLANPPDDPTRKQNHTSIAWPTDLLLNENRRVVGYVMPRLANVHPLFQFFNPAQRMKICPTFDYFYLHHAALNLASVAGAIHARNYVIGDVNESNILIDVRAMVSFIDTDSFQVRDPQSGSVYRCVVGTPNYTPRDMQGENFTLVDRSVEHDLFGLGTLMFRLLMEGTFPFDGVFAGSGDSPPYEERISYGHFPYGGKSVPYTVKPLAPPLTLLHPDLQRLFVRCFEAGHQTASVRPSAREWRDTLQTAETSLSHCSANPQHRYGNHLTSCPWCERAKRFGRDSFPSQQAIKQGKHLINATSVAPLLPSPPTPTVQSPPTPLAPTSPPISLKWIAQTAMQRWQAYPTTPARRKRQEAVASMLFSTIAFLGALFTLVYLTNSSTGKTDTPVKPPDTNTKTIPSNTDTVKEPETLTPQPTNSAPFEEPEMVAIPGGTFTMGSTEQRDEQPVRVVKVSAFSMCKNDITVGQYAAYCSDMGKQMPSESNFNWGGSKRDHPIVNVSWDDANGYCQWLSQKTGKTYDLPTEAEWEYAARGLKESKKYPWGDEWDASKCSNSVSPNSSSGTSSVGSYPANDYGLNDMSGNVWQWCKDWHADKYDSSDTDNPKGASSGTGRVLRGGSWSDFTPDFFRCAYRLRYTPGLRNYDYGFRVVLRVLR